MPYPISPVTNLIQENVTSPNTKHRLDEIQAEAGSHKGTAP